MSTVKADNFTWKTGQATGQSGTNVTGDQIVYGVAKSWINYDGTSGGSVRASFNTSSKTRNGTGDYTLNFTVAMPDTNYTYTGLAAFGEANSTATGRYVSPYVGGGGVYPFGLATGSLRFTTTYAVNVSNQDCQFVNIIVFGN